MKGENLVEYLASCTVQIKVTRQLLLLNYLIAHYLQMESFLKFTVLK